VILPDAAADPEPLLGTIHLITVLSKLDVKETKIAGRAVSHLEEGPVRIAWWIEGKHIVLTVGTDKPEEVVKRLDSKDAPRLTATALFKRVRGFDKFETAARAFVDTAALVKFAGSRGKDVTKLLADLGLDGLKSVVFYSGFDGDAARSLAEIEAPGPRKGLLALGGNKPFRLSDVPALPEDVTGWSMANFNFTTLHDTTVTAAGDVMELVSPENRPNVKEVLKKADDLLGISIRDDLLAALGDRVVTYNSPAEGPLSLGQTFLIQVKDAKKLQAALDQAIKSLAAKTEADVTVVKKTYHGVDVREVHFQQQGFIFLPSYAIYKDWLVFGYYPQQVHGFILRADGKLPVWKPSTRVAGSLDRLPGEFGAVMYADPRPTLKQLLSIAPLIAGTINSFQKDFQLDVGSLPNAHEAASHLFPNVTVVTDDGTTIRVETRASLSLPFDANGLDLYAAFILFSFGVRF